MDRILEVIRELEANADYRGQIGLIRHLAKKAGRRVRGGDDPVAVANDLKSEFYDYQASA